LAQLSETSLAKRSSEPADTSAEFSAGAAAANDEARTRQGRCSKDHPEGISAPEQTRKLRGRWRPESAGGAVVEIMQNDLRLLATRGAARRARAELLRLLESIFDAPNQGKVASFEELRGRHVKALASLGKFFRMTGARKDIADQFYALSVMLHDLDRGIVHPMLLAKKPRGRLDDRSDVWAIRVIAACGVECLICGGLSRREAGRRAAKEFPALKSLLRTGTTLKTALVRWRDAVIRGPLNDIVARGAAREFRHFLGTWGDQLTREQFGTLGKAYLKSASGYTPALLIRISTWPFPSSTALLAT
jgi:hypothetical protein